MKFCSADSCSQIISSSLHPVTPFKLKKQDQGHTLSPFFYPLHLKTPCPFLHSYSHLLLQGWKRSFLQSEEDQSLFSILFPALLSGKCPSMLLSLSSIWNLYSLVFTSTVKKTYGSNSNSTTDLLCDLGQLFNHSVTQIPHPIERLWYIKCVRVNVNFLSSSLFENYMSLQPPHLLIFLFTFYTVWWFLLLLHSQRFLKHHEWQIIFIHPYPIENLYPLSKCSILLSYLRHFLVIHLLFSSEVEPLIQPSKCRKKE